jgi:Kef-type K+ transport system membrane component KefB
MPTLYCPKCGYNLTGLTEDRCPECGGGFSRAELAAIGGIKYRSLGIPLASLLLPPIVFTVLSFLAFSIDGRSSSSGPMLSFLFVLMGLCALAGLALSIFTGRRLARRLAMRPPKSRPNINSVVLTIIFALIFFSAQFCLGFFGFFVGCAMNINL